MTILLDRATFERHRAALIEYLRQKVEIADWHGVSDAANDLRVLEAQHEAALATREEQA